MPRMRGLFTVLGVALFSAGKTSRPDHNPATGKHAPAASPAKQALTRPNLDLPELPAGADMITEDGARKGGGAATPAT